MRRNLDLTLLHSHLVSQEFVLQMTTIKILYKDIPGRNLVSSADGVRIWNRNIRAIDQVHTNSLLPILDLLGLDYVFSKDADAVPIIDVGSLDPSSEKFTAICDNAANTYKKFILCTTQEPWQWHHVEQLLEKYGGTSRKRG